MGLVGIIILTVLASGCISESTNGTKTFNDGNMSFNYPASFNYTQPENENGTTLDEIANFENPQLFNLQLIEVVKDTNTDLSSAEARNKSISIAKRYNKTDIISISNDTNSNGILIEKYTCLSKDIITSRFNVMFFKINNDIYGIRVGGLNFNEKELDKTTDIIFQSIK